MNLWVYLGVFCLAFTAQAIENRDEFSIPVQEGAQERQLEPQHFTELDQRRFEDRLNQLRMRLLRVEASLLSGHDTLNNRSDEQS